MWAIIGSIIKYFKFDYDFVLHGISWSNLSMLLATIPSYESKSDEEKEIAPEDEEAELRKTLML